MKKNRDGKTKRIFIIIMILSLFTAIAAMTAVSAVTADLAAAGQDTYNLTIEYLYEDGSTVHESYVNHVAAGEAVDITVTNPTVPGCVPMTAREGGVPAPTTTFKTDSLDRDITYIVYYVVADTYYNLRINYLFKDGTPAHDPYVATYHEGDAVDVTVTNPKIDGFVPMTAAEDGVSAETTTFTSASLSSDMTQTVYYVAGMTPYRVMYYKQNIYDDLYTRDNTVAAQYTNRYGKTGSNPTELEDEELFDGFTNLFHEPDAIAADGSTVFRVYYDRNYYTVLFDLGDKGYGVEPVYAKYQSPYHISEPKRLGYTFLGWMRTDKDSAAGSYRVTGPIEGEDGDEKAWMFVDENGNEYVDNNGAPLFDEHGIPYDSELDTSDYYINFYDGTVPAHDEYYKAIWSNGLTSYSVVYWIQNPDGENILDEIAEAQTIGEARTLISRNYSVAAAKDVHDVPSGTHIDLNTVVKNVDDDDVQLWNFFGFNLSAQGIYTDEDGNVLPMTDEDGNPLDKDGNPIDFAGISEAKSEELHFENGEKKDDFYVFNDDLSDLQFHGQFEGVGGHETIEVAGDGTTRINVYYDRKDFTLKFYYARQGYTNGALDPNKISLTNSTKNFSDKATDAQYLNTTSKDPLEAIAEGTWQKDIAGSLPQVKDEYKQYVTEGYDDFTDNSNGRYRYYYYQVQAQYGEPLQGKWLIDAITRVPKKGNNYTGQYCEPGSWAVEYYTYYRSSHKTVNNFTVKGIYERLDDELMFETQYRNTNVKYNELHYLLSWTNTSTKDDWNYGTDRILHFTYENYTELLPREVSMMEDDNNNDGSPDGPQALISNGTYENIYVKKTVVSNNTYYELVDPSVPFVYNANTRYYGLTTSNRIETTDSGSQYNINDLNTKTTSVYTDQVPTAITGFKLENYRKFKTDKTVTDPSALAAKLKNGQIVIDRTNTIVDWSDDTSTYRHATIKFFYQREVYTLKYRNGNRLEESKTRDVMYGAPLNSMYTSGETAGQYRYWFDDPVYFNEDLRDYYTFAGWYYTPYYYRLVDKDTFTMPADDTTLYAKWVPKTINVIFYPTYNDFYADTHREEGDENVYMIEDPYPVNYGDYIPINKVPANINDDDNEDNSRPDLVPPAEGAMFAGWYYMRDNIPVRFEPENIPVTALNRDSSVNNGNLRLFAEWVTKDVGKYKITYVEKDNPEVEVASPTTGRAFVWKTRTFNAKGGAELNEDHAWTDDGINWWPTANSHSMVIKANSMGSEYEPNTYSFEYVQKHGVHYRVQYLDAASRKPLLDPAETGKDDMYTTHASVREDAPFIPGYVAEEMSQTLILTASTKETEQAQKEEELDTNVITFYYNKNDKEYVYEVEYYKQNIDNDDYTLAETEYMQADIVDDPDTAVYEGDTTVSVESIYNSRYAKLFADNGFTRVAGATKVTVVGSGGTTTNSVSDSADVVITGTEKTTIKVYFARNRYDYTVQYVDFNAEREYLDAVEEGTADGKWNGVMQTISSSLDEKVEKEVTISAPQDLSYDHDNDVSTADVPYTRINNQDLKLTIAPATVSNPNINLIKVYYKKFYDRELQYKLICVNDSEHTDYDPVTGAPLFGGLSSTDQTVSSYEAINSVTFYSFNNAKNTTTNNYLHDHRYTFLGWYSQPERGDNDEYRLTTDTTLSNDKMGLDGALPARDSTYYALVEQDTVSALFEFRIVDAPLPRANDSMSPEQEVAIDAEAAAIVASAQSDPDGSITGSYFEFKDPSDYENGSEIMWRRSEGYSLSIQPKDDRVYKYEFTEWWEENTTTHQLTRKHNWHNSEWNPTEIERQLDRTEDKHVIAVYKPRVVESLDYTINYDFTDRTGVDRTYTVKGTLNSSQLDKTNLNYAVTDAPYFELNDEFIIAHSPYESNYGETLHWSDQEIEKTSKKGDPSAKNDDDKTDRTIATATAVQTTKQVAVHYRLTPDGAFEAPFYVDLGANYARDSRMRAIEAPASYNGMAFQYWKVCKTAEDDAFVVAKSYETLFDLCMMDSYFLTPYYEGAASGSGEKSAKLNASAVQVGDEDWLAWTWNEGGDGEWVRPDENMVFSGLNDMVKFVRVPKGTDVSAGTWDGTFTLWKMSYELEVQDGNTYRFTGWGDDNLINGEWDAIPEPDPAAVGETPTEAPTEEPTLADPTITLTHLDYTRNRWTDDEIDEKTGRSDLLYTDFEIAFEDNRLDIYKSEGYTCGVVLELCGKMGATATFDQNRDYGFYSDFEALAAAISAGNSTYNTPNKSATGTVKTRNIMYDIIPTESLTNHNRVEFYKPFANAYKETVTDGTTTKTYTNANYLMKATAFLVKDGKYYFSNSVYVCLKDIASKDNAAGIDPSIWDTTPAPTQGE